MRDLRHIYLHTAQRAELSVTHHSPARKRIELRKLRASHFRKCKVSIKILKKITKLSSKFENFRNNFGFFVDFHFRIKSTNAFNLNTSNNRIDGFSEFKLRKIRLENSL